MNVHLLAELAGHTHISTTQRYIDVNDAQLAHAVEQASITRFPSQLGGAGEAIIPKQLKHI